MILLNCIEKRLVTPNLKVILCFHHNIEKKKEGICNLHYFLPCVIYRYFEQQFKRQYLHIRDTCISILNRTVHFEKYSFMSYSGRKFANLPVELSIHQSHLLALYTICIYLYSSKYV